MFLRLLFVLLAALNIAVGAWLLLGQPYPRGSTSTDPGVPELHLLSEMTDASPRPPASIPALTAVPPATTETDERPQSCLTLGPFATPQDLRAARQALAPTPLRMRSRQEQVSQTAGWRVYLPPAASHAQALAMARRLQGSGITDYYLANSGDQMNTISLGLFKELVNARKRLDQVTAAGFRPRISERSDTLAQYWLDLVVADRDRFDWHTRVHAAGVGSHDISCF